MVDDVVVSQSPREVRALWAVREDANRVLFSIKGLIGVISHPAGTDGNFPAGADAAIHAVDPGADIYVFGHLGDGNLHYQIRTVDPAAARHRSSRRGGSGGGARAWHRPRQEEVAASGPQRRRDRCDERRLKAALILKTSSIRDGSSTGPPAFSGSAAACNAMTLRRPRALRSVPSRLAWG